MHTWIRTLCRPFMRQKFHPTRTAYEAIPRPDGPPHAHATGLHPSRILILGTDAATGWGVRSHDLALPGQLARALHNQTGRGVDIDLLNEPRGVGINALVPLMRFRDFSIYDAIVVVGGAADAAYLRPETHWKADLDRLLPQLRRKTPEGVPIVVLGIPQLSALPIYGITPGGVVDTWTHHLNEITRKVCAAIPGTYFHPTSVAATSRGNRYRGPDDYRDMAVDLTSALVPLLNVPSPTIGATAPVRNHFQSIERRSEAIRALELVDTIPDSRFDLIVHHARDLFGTEAAAFTLVDHDRQWNKTAVGVTATHIPLTESFCATTVKTTDIFVVEDALTDPRSPPASPYRFYAGYPIEAPDGTRIGALCVFDHHAGTAEPDDLALLRDLALAIQEQLDYSLQQQDR